MSLADILIFIIGKSCRFEPEMENFPAQERGKIFAGENCQEGTERKSGNFLSLLWALRVPSLSDLEDEKNEKVIGQFPTKSVRKSSH